MEQFFITEISPLDINDGNKSFDLNISNYRLPTHEQLEKRLKTKVSKCRWATITYEDDSKQLKGSTLTMYDGTKFKIVYSWFGLSAPEDWHTHMGYTIRIKPIKGYFKTSKKYFKKIIKDIVELEGEKQCRGSIIWTFMYKILPYSKHHAITIWFYKTISQIKNKFYYFRIYVKRQITNCV